MSLLHLNVFKNYITTFLFIISTLCYLLYLFKSPFQTFYYDAVEYWHLGRVLHTEDGFNILKFYSPLRGVIFALINYSLIRISAIWAIEEVSVFKVFSAIFFSASINILFPYFVKKAFGIKPVVWQMLLFNCLIFIFWRGYFNFPLTDFFSIVFLTSALFFWISTNKVYIPLSGLFFAFAMNFRPAYQIVLFVLVLWIIFDIVYNTTLIKNTFLKVILFMVGFGIGCIPQFYVNSHVFKKNSPFVQTSEKESENLFLNQLKWGMYFEKYETNVGTDYPIPQIVFLNKEGVELHEKEAPRITSIPSHLNTVARNPIFFVKMYIKHIFGALDINYSSPYIMHINGYSFLFSLLNYSLIFTFILIILKSFRVKNIPVSQKFLLIILISPALIVIPTAIEVRFFLPLFLIIYSTVIFYDYRKLYTGISIKKLMIYASAYCLFLLGYFYFSRMSYKNLQHPIVKSYCLIFNSEKLHGHILKIVS